MGGGKKKNPNNNSILSKSGGNSNSGNNSAWVGKYRIVVKTWTGGVRSELFVVDLKENMIVMKHPQVIWSDNYFKSIAVLHKGTLSVVNIGLDKFTNSPRFNSSRSYTIVVNEQDYVHSDDSNATCTCSLDLTNTPPKWSNWRTLAPKMMFKRHLPYLATLDNKIFAFKGTRLNTKNPEVYQIVGGSSHDDKWEELTIPFGGDLTPNDPAIITRIISDPNNNRLIAYFGNNMDSIYAYYPNLKNKSWELLHQHLPPGGDMIFRASEVANQVVGENLILCFDPDEQFFMAYNIFTNKWLEVEWLFQFDPHKMYFGAQSKLVHLGNDILCLAVSYKKYPEHKTLIQFLRFSVRRVEELVQLTPLSFHPIFIDNFYCLADTFIPF